MKKNKYMICALPMLLLLIGCDASPIYSVNAFEEAIITQNGEVKGEPKEPGLHFKIPIVQKVHKIQINRVRYLTVPVPQSNSLKAKIMWTVKDSKKFFYAKKKGNIAEIFKSTVTPKYNKIIREYGLDTIVQISREQLKDPDYTNDARERILEHLQESVDVFGIRIFNTFFEEI